MWLILGTVTVLLSVLYIWLKNKYSYWEQRGIKGPEPLPFLGNIAKVIFIRESMTEFLDRLYTNYKSERAVGVYTGFTPGLLLRDTELIKHVLIKDFPNFQDRGVKFADESKYQNLFLAEGSDWRILRQKLTPIFTSGKLKNMIPLITRCVNDFMGYIDKLVEQNKDQEIRTLTSKYTLEVIGACAFGVDLNTFTDEHNPFREAAANIFQTTFSGRVKRILIFLVPTFTRFLHNVLKIEIADKKIEIFFTKFVNELILEREGKEKVRKDFMDLMIELKEQGKAVRRDEDKSSEMEIDAGLIAAQVVIFYAAGFETSSGTMSFLMYELAMNPEVQERALKEVKEVLKKHDGVLSYEAAQDMAYLNACFDEALRKYPVIGQLFRKSLERYTFPGTDITIEKGTAILIPVSALQSDPNHFEDPTVFRPDRFLGENKSNIKQCSYIPFGDGPRNCIGENITLCQYTYRY